MSRRLPKSPEPANTVENEKTNEQLILGELAAIREQLTQLVAYLRTKERRAIARKHKAYTCLDNPLVRTHQPTEAQIQEAMRQRIRRQQRQK